MCDVCVCVYINMYIICNEFVQIKFNFEHKFKMKENVI